MRWSTAIALAALLAAGCNNTAPSNDPFAPRLLPSTRVPPPATGAAGAVDGSYYTSPIPGPLPTPAPSALPAGGAGSLDQPSNGPFRANPSGAGSFTPNSSTSLPRSSHRSSPRTHGRVDRSVVQASHVTGASTTPADDEEEEVGEEEEGTEDSGDDVEEATTGGLQPTSARFSKASASSRAVDIMDLPPARRWR